MSNVYEEALKKHAQWQGKIETKVVCEVNNAEDLTLAYTQGSCPAMPRNSSGFKECL